MADDLRERMKEAVSAYTQKITASPEEARKALIREGIYTKTGRLTKNYAPSKADKK